MKLAEDKPLAHPEVFESLPSLLQSPSRALSTPWKLSEWEEDQVSLPPGFIAARDEVCASLGVSFSDSGVATQAFVHQSYLSPLTAFPRNVRRLSNRRLEALGDSVLDLALSSYLYYFAPHAPAGTITQFRNFMRSNEVLASAAEDLRLTELMLVAPSFVGDPSALPEEGSRLEANRHKTNIEHGLLKLKANTLEAFVGAVFVDAGMDAALSFVSSTVLPKLVDELYSRPEHVDPVTLLNNLVISSTKTPPQFTYSRDPDSGLTKVKVFVNEKYVAMGVDNSKRTAKRAAVVTALNVLRKKRSTNSSTSTNSNPNSNPNPNSKLKRKPKL